MTRRERQQIALALYRARPPVIPGTRVIPDDRQRMVWYNTVVEIAKTVAPTLKQRGEFFDLAGVPD